MRVAEIRIVLLIFQTSFLLATSLVLPKRGLSLALSDAAFHYQLLSRSTKTAQLPHLAVYDQLTAPSPPPTLREKLGDMTPIGRAALKTGQNIGWYDTAAPGSKSTLGLQTQLRDASFRAFVAYNVRAHFVSKVRGAFPGKTQAQLPRQWQLVLEKANTDMEETRGAYNKLVDQAKSMLKLQDVRTGTRLHGEIEKEASATGVTAGLGNHGAAFDKTQEIVTGFFEHNPLPKEI